MKGSETLISGRKAFHWLLLCLFLKAVSSGRTHLRYMLLLDDLVTSNSKSVDDCTSLCEFLRSKLLYRNQNREFGRSIEDNSGGDGASCGSIDDGNNQYEHVVCHPIYQILHRCFQEEENQKSIECGLYEAIKLQLSQIIDKKLIIVGSTAATTNSKFSSSRHSARTERDLLSQAYMEMKRSRNEKLTFKTKAQALYEQYQQCRNRRNLLLKVHTLQYLPFNIKLDLLNTPKELYTKIDQELVKICTVHNIEKKKRIKVYRQDGLKRTEVLFNIDNVHEGNCFEENKDEDLLIDIGFKYPGANLFIEI